MEKKWNLQDIRPNEAPRTARANTRTRGSDMRRREEMKETVPQEPSREPKPQKRTGRSSRFKKSSLMKIGIIALVILAIGIGISMLFSGSEIAIYPKFKDVTVQATFAAHLTPTADALAYEMLTFEADGERQVTATGKEDAEERATGSVVLYNSFSDKPLRLVKNTRLESTDKHTFKITESAVVPGYTTDANGTKIPGSVTASVFADGTGEEFNVEPGRFTIPGFAGEPEFDAVYAESTNTFTGGFKGQRYIINDSELQTTKDSLHEELKKALLSKLETERPAGFIVYEDAVTFAFDSLPSVDGGNGLATIKERGRLMVPIFKADSFASYIAKNTISGYEEQPVSIVDPEALTFTYASSTPTSETQSIDFTLKGNARIVWTFDQDKLKSDLAGLSKSALPNVLSGYPAISKAEATLRPFWRQSFPNNADDIKLRIVIEEQK